MAGLLDAEPNKVLAQQVKKHLLECESCATDFKEMEEVVELLKPRRQPSAPFLLRQNIIEHLSKEDTKMVKSKQSGTFLLNTRTKKMVAVAAILIATLIIVPLVRVGSKYAASTANAETRLIEKAIGATSLIKSMVMKLTVRTLPNDNFSLVGVSYSPVEHTISKSFGIPAQWRIDKGERVIICNGKDQVMWLPQLNSGFMGSVDANFAEWFKLLLDPASIMAREQMNLNNKDSKITLQESPSEVRMTVTSKAEGNFINDYCKNTSIQESDNRREYVFDSQTKLLKSLKVYIINGKTETLIVETQSIKYDVPVDSSLFTFTLPQGGTLVDLAKKQNLQSETFSSVSSKRAAELIFEAMSTNNWDAIKIPMDAYSGFFNRMQKAFGGLKVVKIGESFKSGTYCGEFVPYEVILNDGTIKKHNIALRNDNKNKVWLVDGGL